jgi:hypothetical protein
MIEMQMRTDDQVDVFGPQAGAGQVLQIRPLLQADRGQAALLVVPTTGIDQDGATIDSQQEAVHADPHPG